MSVDVGIIMGSQSDWPTLKPAAEILGALGVTHEVKIVSAHRTPDRLWTYGKTAVERGLKASRCPAPRCPSSRPMET